MALRASACDKSGYVRALELQGLDQEVQRGLPRRLLEAALEVTDCADAEPCPFREAGLGEPASLPLQSQQFAERRIRFRHGRQSRCGMLSNDS